MTQNVPLDLGWAPSACTLPTAEQPLRVAEFDALFAEAVQAMQRPEPTRLRLELVFSPDHAARAAELVAREKRLLLLLHLHPDRRRRQPGAGLDLEHHRAPVRSKGGAIEWVYWDSGTAHLLPRLLRLPGGSTRTHGPLFLSDSRPVPARRPAAADICPHTGRARLGYDRARVLLEKYAGLDLHQLRHSAAPHLGEAEVPLQLIMGKTRHKNPRTAMRYVKPGAEAIAAVTEHLAPPRRRH